eukprot:5245156-Pleurochrysis_carterae.AAC.1
MQTVSFNTGIACTPAYLQQIKQTSTSRPQTTESDRLRPEFIRIPKHVPNLPGLKFNNPLNHVQSAFITMH